MIKFHHQVIAKPKGVKVSVEKPVRFSGKSSKLPPRLARQKEQRDKERKEAKVGGGFEMKIECWDNELANNIPALTGDIIPEPAGMWIVVMYLILNAVYFDKTDELS